MSKNKFNSYRRNKLRLLPFLVSSILAVTFFLSPLLAAQSRNALFFFELQAVSAYNFSQKSFEFYSYLPHHAMQKSGPGLETLVRFYRRSSDLGYFSLQLRAVYDEDKDQPLRFQLYNAFFRLKTGLANFWLGHSKPALGLNYSLDNHALLLPDATMLGHNFDRDWGLGLSRDFRQGDLALSLTTGSGMKLKFQRNFLLSGRISYGVLARDNFNFGFSAFTGRVLEEMAEEEQTSSLIPWSGLALDVTYFWLNWESRLEINMGRRAGLPWHLVFLRPGLNLLEEGRLKLEAQLSLLKHGGDGGGWSYLVGPAITYRLNSDLALRSMFLYDRQARSSRLVLQIYYYRKIF